jgi:hypothetical protein
MKNTANGSFALNATSPSARTAPLIATGDLGGGL